MTPTIKHVTLAELHEWILEARSIIDVPTAEINGEPQMEPADEIVVDGDVDAGDKAVDVDKTTAELRELLASISTFDSSFHDRFDCR